MSGQCLRRRSHSSRIDAEMFFMLYECETIVRGRNAVLVFALLTCGNYSFGQPGASVPDLSGSWERMDDVGGGSFGGILEKIIPKAALKPEFIEANRREAARQQSGDVVAFSSKWCQTFHYPFFM